MQRTNSRLLCSCRLLGLVCNDVVPVVRYLPKRRQNICVCAVGNQFYCYDCAKLRLTAQSEAHPADIECLAADRLYVYTGCGRTIRAFHLSRQVKFTYECDDDVRLLLPFGGTHLISVDRRGHVIVWDVELGERYLELLNDQSEFDISALCHPPTYLNKILLGSRQSKMHLVNVKTGQVVYTFKSWHDGSAAAINVLQPSPAVDVVAVGFEDGRVVLHNLRFDESLFQFKLVDQVAVTALAFRQSNDSAESWLISGSRDGLLAIWDLEQRKLLTQLQQAHRGRVTLVAQLFGDPVFVSAGADNALKTWIFDLEGSLPRLLVSWEGHSLPPTVVRFHGNEMVLSAGLDGTVKMQSVLKWSKRQNLGTGGVMSRKAAKKRHISAAQFEHRLRFEAIVALASDRTRESGWDNIVCCHDNSCTATTWTSRRLRLGSHRLCHNRFHCEQTLRQAVLTCCTLSCCGNFAILGYSSGHLDSFNVQSGLFRGSFVDKGVGLKCSHSDAVAGVFVDSLNRVVASAAGPTVKFWRFKSKSLIKSVELDAAVQQLSLHRQAALLAAALCDAHIAVLDVVCGRVARRIDHSFVSMTSPKEVISAIAWGASGHWLFVACNDARLYVWDIPSGGRLIDIVGFRSACTSLDISPNGMFVCSSHRDFRGVCIWTNRTLFDSGIPLKPLPVTFQPLPIGHQEEVVVGDDGIGEDETSVSQGAGQIENTLTLSGLPTTRWAYLLQLEAIKARNRPKQPPQKPKSAPFFLPTVAGLQPAFDLSQTNGASSEADVANLRAKMAQLDFESTFSKALSQCATASQFQECFQMLKSMGPSALDIELRSLGQLSAGENSCALLQQFLRLVESMLTCRRDFDLAQSFLGLFLKLHYEQLLQQPNAALNELIGGLLDATNQSWAQLDTLFDSSLAVLQFVRNAMV